MKSIIFLIALPSILAFRVNELTTHTIEDAINQKLVTAKATSTGSYSGSAVSLTVVNKSEKAIKLTIPPGYSFIPENGEEQTLITTTEQFVAVAGTKSVTISLSAYCSEASDKSPTKDSKFSFGPTKNKELQKLADFTAKNKTSNSVTQSAVWAISDNRSISNISMNTPADKALRAYVCAMKGVKDTWFSSPQSHLVDDAGNIISETVNVEGKLIFSLTMPTSFRQEIRTRAGVTKIISRATKPLPNGKNIEYSFNLSVKGWKKGDYDVVLISTDEKLIGSWPFTI